MLGTSSLIFYKYTGTYEIIMYTVFEILWSLPVQQISSASEFVIDNVSYQIHQVLRGSESDCNKCDQILTPGIYIYEHNNSPVTFPLTSSSPHQSGWPYRGVPFFTVSNSVQKVQDNIPLQQVGDTHTHRHTMGSLLFLSHPTITTSQFKPLVVLILQSKCSWSGTIKTLQLYDQRLYWSLYREAV